jgi:hypothetical protein
MLSAATSGSVSILYFSKALARSQRIPPARDIQYRRDSQRMIVSKNERGRPQIHLIIPVQYFESGGFGQMKEGGKIGAIAVDSEEELLSLRRYDAGLISAKSPWQEVHET